MKILEFVTIKLIYTFHDNLNDFHKPKREKEKGKCKCFQTSKPS